MGHIKDIANQSKIQTFPSSTFEIVGDVPASQCSESKIGGENGETFFPVKQLRDPGTFIGFNLIGKVCTIITNPGGNVGEFDITSNTDNHINFVQNPGNGSPTLYYVHNGSEFIITRDIQSFAEFIDAAGYAYTIKGGTLYTNIPTAKLQPACSILFDPLT